MKRTVSTAWLGVIAACLAAGAGVSCGTIRDGKGEVYTTKTVGPAGDQLVLDGAVLDVWQDCLDAPAALTFRRYETIAHAGAVGHVFELRVPTPTTFKNNAGLIIDTTPEVAADPRSGIGFLIPGVENEQWVPSSSDFGGDCPQGSVVCGAVQAGSFNSPGGNTPPEFATTVLLFAIVTRCTSIADCGPWQACNSGACQQCPTRGECNR